MSEIIPRPDRLCPFLNTKCRNKECALYMDTAKACAILTTSVWTGDMYGSVLKLKEDVDKLTESSL
jgi:hypothetical protein